MSAALGCRLRQTTVSNYLSPLSFFHFSLPFGIVQSRRALPDHNLMIIECRCYEFDSNQPQGYGDSGRLCEGFPQAYPMGPSVRKSPAENHVRQPFARRDGALAKVFLA
jgi:hypothetical protein